MQQTVIRATGAAKEERTPFLQLRDISKAYGPTFANQELSFDIRRGEVIGLIGANGAGKSTLMRILAGVTVPDSGTIRIDGETLAPRRFSSPRRAVGEGPLLAAALAGARHPDRLPGALALRQPDGGRELLPGGAAARR